MLERQYRVRECEPGTCPPHNGASQCFLFTAIAVNTTLGANGFLCAIRTARKALQGVMEKRFTLRTALVTRAVVMLTVARYHGSKRIGFFPEDWVGREAREAVV